MRRILPAAVAVLLAAVAAAPAPAQAPAYRVPADNPFVGTPGARGEVFAYGLRNPFRWSFDRATGDMLIGDVGGGEVEEVTLLRRGGAAGANLGWNCREGTLAGPGGCTAPGARAPIYQYANPADGGAAITGGYVVRDPALPAFAGRYLFGDFFSNPFGGQIQALALTPGATPTEAGEIVESLVAFGEDAAGHLYAVSLGGAVYRLSQSGGQIDKASIGSFDQPMAVAPVPGDANRLFVVQRQGVLKLKVGAAAHDFLDISGLVSTDGERGFLAAAAAPDYASSGRVFVFYADTGGDLRLEEVRRSAADPTRADPSTRRELLRIEHSEQSNHNGGQLLFGPDAKLYLSVGDGGGQGDVNGDAQSLGSLLGKVLRLDVGAGPGPATTLPNRAPKLAARVRKRQRVLRQRGVVTVARCDERCRNHGARHPADRQARISAAPRGPLGGGGQARAPEGAAERARAERAAPRAGERPAAEGPRAHRRARRAREPVAAAARDGARQALKLLGAADLTKFSSNPQLVT